MQFSNVGGIIKNAKRQFSPDFCTLELQVDDCKAVLC